MPAKPQARSGTFCLDLAGIVGWSWGEPGGAIAFGSQSFIDAGGLGAMLHAFSCWLDLQMVQRRPARVVFESPVLYASRTHIQTARRLMSMAGITEMISAVWEGCEVLEEDSSVVVKWLTGKARWTDKSATGSHSRRAAANRALKKSMTMQAVRAKGFRVRDDNEADAVALFLYTETHLDKILRMGDAA